MDDGAWSDIEQRMGVIKDTMSECSQQAIQYARTMKSSADGIDAYVQSQSLANVVGAKFVGVLKGIGTAMMDMLITFAATAAINFVVKQITDAINHEKDLREAAEESSSALNEKAQSIDNYIAQITALKESLASGTLSEQESYEARKQLIGIQDELVSKYGDEVQGVDLLNSSLQTQLDLLNQLKDNDMRSWLSDNAEAIDNAQKRLSQTSYYSQLIGSIKDGDYEELKNIAGKYADRGVTLGAGTSGFEFDISANMDDAKAVLADLNEDIQSSKRLSDDTKATLESSLSTTSQTIQSDIDTNKKIVDQAAQYQILTNQHYKELYDDLQDASNEYAEAVAKDDATAIEAALKHSRSAIEAFNQDTFNQLGLSEQDNASVKNYMQTQVEQLTETTKAKAAQIGLQEALKNTGTAYDICQRNLANLTESEKQYGNVSNTNRDVIKWNAKTLEDYKDAINSWDWDVKAGDYSTVKGMSDAFGEGHNALEIAYTPMLQTDNGLVPLERDTVSEYIWALVDNASSDTGKIDVNKLLELDAQGLDMQIGDTEQRVYGLVAAVQGQIVDGAKLTAADVAAIAGSSEEELIDAFGTSSKYVGKSMHDIQDETLKWKAIGKDALSAFDASTLTEYVDLTDKEVKSLTDSLGQAFDNISGLSDLDLQDMRSLQLAGSSLGAYTIDQRDGFYALEKAADTLGMSLTDMIDLMVQLGVVTGKDIKYTNEFTASALSAASSASSAVSLVSTALQSQGTTSGVSSDSYSELIKEHSEYAAALEYENGYMKLNSDAAKKITQAKIDEAEANIKLAYTQNQMKYAQAKADLEALNKAVEQNGTAEGKTKEQVDAAKQSLENQCETLRENCRNLQMQYSLLMQNSGAYQDWVNAQSATESGDMYDSIIKAKEAIAEGLKNGKVGTEKFKAAVELTIPVEFQSDPAEYIKRLNRYFTQESDGDDATGIQNFITDCVTAGIMSESADGQLQMVADMTTEKIAKKLKLSTEDVQSIFGELQEYGLDFDWDSLLGDPITNLQMEIDDVQEQMDALGEDAAGSDVWNVLNDRLTELKGQLSDLFSDMDSSQIDDAVGQIVDDAIKAGGEISDAQADMLNSMGRMQNLYDLNQAQQEVDDLQAKYSEAMASGSESAKDYATQLTTAQQKVTSLLQTENKLGTPTAIEIQTFSVDYAAGKIDGVQHTAEETNDMLKSMGINIDTYTADSALSQTESTVTTISDEASNITMNIDTSVAQSRIKEVQTALDSMQTTIPVSLQFSVGGSIVSSLLGGGLRYSAKKATPSKGKPASAAGTEGASGGKTLVGELGNEIVVNPHTGKWYTVGDHGAEFVDLPRGAIVFNHEKTQKLLDQGFVGSYGEAYANGTAKSSGDPGINSGVRMTGTNYRPGKDPRITKTYEGVTKATKDNTKATNDNTAANDANTDSLDENKKALEEQKTALEKQKTALEDASNKLKIYGQAAISEIEKRVDALNKEKDAQDDAYQAELDNLNNIKDARDKEVEDEIDRLNDEKDAKDKAWNADKKRLQEEMNAKDKAWSKEKKRLQEEKETTDKAYEDQIKPLQEKKEALQDANDEEDRAIKLAELQDALAKAKANRTVRLYNREQGFIWAADESAVNDAQTALDDQMRDWNREDAIQAVEDEIDRINDLKDAFDDMVDSKIDAIDKEQEAYDEATDEKIDAIEKEMDAYDESIENRIDELNDWKDAFDQQMQDEIDAVQARKDAYDEAIDAEIDKLDDLKDQWNDVMGLIGTSWEDYQLQLEAAAHFSDMSFGGMKDDLIGYKDDVLANMQEIGGVTDQIDAITESISQLEEQISNAKSSGGSGGGGGSDIASGLGSLGGDAVDGTIFDDLNSSAQDTMQTLDDLQQKYQDVADQTDGLNSSQLDLIDTISVLNVGTASHQRAVEELCEVQKQSSENTAEMAEYHRQYVEILAQSTDLTTEQKVALLEALQEQEAGFSDCYTTIDELMEAYADRLINDTELDEEQRQAQLDHLIAFSEQYDGSYSTIDDILNNHATSIVNNTTLTNEQRQAQLDNLLAFGEQYGASYDAIEGVLNASVEAIATNTTLTNEQRQAQMDSIAQLAEKHGISKDSIIKHLQELAVQETVAKDSTVQTHTAMQNTVAAACQAMNVSYDSTIAKCHQMVAAYQEAQRQMAEAIGKADFNTVMPLGTATSHGNKIQWGKPNFDPLQHATGVLNAATTHIAITDEKGPEIKMRKPSSGQYSLIEKGSSVIPAQPSANLWKFGLDPDSFIAAHTSQRSIKSVEITQPDMSGGVSMGDVNIQMYGVNDPDSFARVLHDRIGGIMAQEFSQR